MKNMVLGALLSAVAGTPLLAGHANPWAEDEDEVLSQYHEVNLVQSEDTPGEDEMLGIMVRQARGKLDDSIGTPASPGQGHGENGGGQGPGKG